jgi:Carboxypeptidase regulatory-like domain
MTPTGAPSALRSTLPAIGKYPRYVVPLLASLVIASGLFGTVQRGPTTPACRAGKPCSAPAAHVRLRFVRAGRAARSVVTSDSGRYRILLPPGTYTITVAGTSRLERLSPATVTVGSTMTRRNLLIDTGIR